MLKLKELMPVLLIASKPSIDALMPHFTRAPTDSDLLEINRHVEVLCDCGNSPAGGF